GQSFSSFASLQKHLSYCAFLANWGVSVMWHISSHFARISPVLRTFRYQLKPTSKQVRLLQAVLEICREIYNAGLQERREAWRLERKKISYYDQSASIKEIRTFRPDVEAIAFVFVRESLRRLDFAFQNFFRRCSSGESPGYPRFKSPDRFDS